LCFQRRERGDVLAGECKIAGSAQRRQRGAVLQHGSVLLARSRFAPELPGISELLSDEVNIQRLRQAWLVRLAKRLKMDVSQAALPDTLLQAAREIAERKFAHPDWTCHR
jgi:lipoate-protein ligase A